MTAPTPAPVDDTDDQEPPSTPLDVLEDLAQTQLRCMASPHPKDPAAFGWQMHTAVLAGYAARLLHALNAVDPAKAAELAAHFDGPLGDGPDPEEETDWLEANVARPAGADFSAWIDEAQKLACEAQAATEKKESTTV